MPEILAAPCPFEFPYQYLSIQSDSTAEGAQADVTTALAANRNLNFDEEGDDEPPDFVTDESPPSVGKDQDAAREAGGKGEGNKNKVEADRLAKESMERRRQKAKIQDYVRQLPPEFRR